jgi:hypothetical protein
VGSGPSGTPPSWLIFMLVSSGAMFHLQSTMFKRAGHGRGHEGRTFLRGGHGAVHGQERSVVWAQNRMANMMGSMFGGRETGAAARPG